MKNLLIFITSFSGGGAEMVASNLCKYLNKDLFNVSLCHLKDRGYRGDELHSAGFKIFGLREPKFTNVDYFSFLKLRSIIHKEKIDIIHSHSTDSLIDSSLCKLTLPGVKLIHTFHFGNYPNYVKKYLFLEKIFCRVPDRLVAVGNIQKRSIQQTFNIRNKRITTVWNGVGEVEPDIDIEISQRFKDSTKVIVGSFSSFIEQKGLPYLLDVAFLLKKKKSNVILLIAGDGPLRGELELKSKRLGLEETVFFLGWVKNVETTLLPFIDIFVQSSLWEAMSIAILQAMAAGKPIVATNVGENGEIIKNGESGFIVSPNNVNDMVVAIELLEKDRELRRKFSENARIKYEKEFAVNMMAKRYEQIYMDL